MAGMSGGGGATGAGGMTGIYPPVHGDLAGCGKPRPPMPGFTTKYMAVMPDAGQKTSAAQWLSTWRRCRTRGFLMRYCSAAAEAGRRPGADALYMGPCRLRTSQVEHPRDLNPAASRFFPRACVWELDPGVQPAVQALRLHRRSKRPDELSLDECMRVAGELVELGCGA